MRRVVVIPVSGYGNRLQAIASASILADDVGAELAICWIPDEVAPVPADRVLSQALCNAHLVTADELRDTTGIDPAAVPRYLHRRASTITLAGHDRGEQVFMGDLAHLLAEAGVHTVVIRAGGRYALPTLDEVTFRERRRTFYRGSILTDAIEAAAAQQAGHRAPFLGLHLRYTDRAHQAPTSRTIERAVRSLARRTGIEGFFIASDTASARIAWSDRLARLGLGSWIATHDSWDRSTAGSEVAALVDWRILTRSAGLVYFAESTFAVEAAVASDGCVDSLALPPSPARSLAVRGMTLLRAAATYPRRHGWLPGA